MSHNRDLSAAAGQFGFHSSNIGIGSEAPRYPLDVHGGNLLVSGSAAGNIILEDRGVGDSSRPFHVVSSDGGKFVINRSNRNASGTTTSSVNSLTLNSSGNLGLGGQTSPSGTIHINDLSANGYELKISGNALQFNRSSNSYIDQLHDTGSILFRMTSSNTEAMRITSDRRIGINDSGPDFHLDVNGNVALREGQVLTWHDGSGNKAGDIYMDSSDNFVIRNTSSVAERLRIDANGTLLVNAAIDNTGGHGQIVAHAPLTGNTIYKAIEIGNTDAAGTARGAAICGQPKSNSHLPYTLLGSWDHGDNTDCYYGGGWGGAMRPATRHRFYTNSSYPTSGGSGTERMRILNNGHVNIGGYLSSVTNSGLHVGRGSGGTAAGESVLAATLGDHSTMVSALLTVKNAGNRGSQGHSSGSPLAKFEFNNGTAFEIDKHGRVTKPYQPAFKCKLSSATGANFTGYFVFGNVSYNIGSHYNSSNGRFTAPVDGRYLFAWYTNMERAGGNGSFYAEWYINGNAQGNRMYSHHSGAWELIGGTVIFDLNTNDYVQIQAITSGNWDGNQYGSYSGCLLG